MSVNAHRARITETPIAVGRDDIKLGKDMLELVSTAMYVDPMTVYREYIQNAADAIDAAREAGVLGTAGRGEVAISIDPTTRTIRIRDNGIGIPAADFASRLTALGGSMKRGTGARGFRGVGRLVGLGHAQELIFRSRPAGQDLVCELRWDCRRLKAALADTSFAGEVGDLITQIVSLNHLPAADYPEHFFEVELSKVIRQRNDKLMDAGAVSDYLAQVAPVPFSPDFRYAYYILSALHAVTDVGEIEIRINDGPPLFRPYRDEIALAPGKTNAFDELSLIEIPGMDGDVAAIAWFLHHNYEGALPVATLIKGVRLRIGNLQIGDHAVLEEMFPEARFNAWSVGEIHILDPRVVPNGRRDQFEQNAHFNNLLNQLGPSARDIARRCRTSSAKRSKLREFELGVEDIRSRLDILQQGSLARTQRNGHALNIEATLERLDRLAEQDQLLGEATVQMRLTIAELRTALPKILDEAAASAGPLDRLPAKQRAMYERMFSLIYDCSANRNAAKALVERIIQKVSAQHPNSGTA